MSTVTIWKHWTWFWNPAEYAGHLYCR